VVSEILREIWWQILTIVFFLLFQERVYYREGSETGASTGD